MLLSLLSKRSLDVEFRDAYGFNVRPQDLQRYKEYANIYKEEEEERLHKWKFFLEQQEVSVDAHSSCTEKLDNVTTETDNSIDEKQKINDEEDNSVETNHTSHVQATSDPGEKVATSDLEVGAPVPPKGKRKVVQTWAEIRSSLGALDCMMSFRVKKNKITRNEHITTGEHHLPATEAKSFFPWKQELEFLVQGGVARELRGEVWQAFVGARARRVEKYYQDLLAPDGHAGDDQKHVKSKFEKWKKQIEKDLPRTFPGHPALNENGRDSLRRLLLAYARHNPSVGYCQAMNFFAGLLLLMMPEENAFWTLVGIIDDYFDGCFSEEMTESQVDQLVFEELMRERFPKLANHLDYLGVQVTWITAPWFLSIFVNMLPWESVMRVWDVLLFEGNRVMLFRTALAILELYGPAVVTTQDAGDAICLLQTLTGSTFDSSQLVLTACMGFNTVTEDKLQSLREKHRPSVLGLLENRDTGDKVCKQSKSLATKLASFKRDHGPLMEESGTDEKECKSLATKLASFKRGPGPLTQESKTDENSGSKPIANKTSASDSQFANQEEFLTGITTDTEVDSIPDLQDQVVWLKIELSKLLEEKRGADLRAEELEAALMEMVKEDNRRELRVKLELFEQEVAELRQALSDKKEQETALLQVLMRVEQEQKVTEDARIRAEQEAAAQRIAAHKFQEKYEKVMATVTEMEKKVVMAESLLEATLQYQSGQSKALSSPRAAAAPPRRTGILSFGLNWRDRNKVNLRLLSYSSMSINLSPFKKFLEKSNNMEATNDSKTTNEGSQTSSSKTDSNGHQDNKKNS
ncbi:GTPase-activating protein [Lithospermum erythrorhizon]|uniref:GTPase-activating protein n=1 Tax=Lithospermum erythrorhizon TaxID=34254 RepID=A0AAV3PKG8_LITER